MFGRRNKPEDNEPSIPVAEALDGIATQVANQVVAALQSEKDIWWFVMDQYDRIRIAGKADDLMNLLGLNLFEVEYRWGKEPFSVEINNPGVLFLENQVKPMLSERFSPDIAELTIAHVFVKFCMAYVVHIARIRLEFATFFRDSTEADGRPELAERWNEVVKALE